MPFERTNRANFAQTVLTLSMGSTDTVAQVESTDGFPSLPCRLVIEPESPSRREIILFDGSLTATTFQTLTVDNRYIEGSAAAAGLTHPTGSTVISAPLSQDIDEVFDALEQTLTDVDTAVAGAVSDAEQSATAAAGSATAAAQSVTDAEQVVTDAETTITNNVEAQLQAFVDNAEIELQAFVNDAEEARDDAQTAAAAAEDAAIVFAIALGG